MILNGIKDRGRPQNVGVLRLQNGVWASVSWKKGHVLDSQSHHCPRDRAKLPRELPHVAGRRGVLRLFLFPKEHGHIVV